MNKDNEWSFAGGGVDEGETAEQAVIRELEEELGSKNFRIVGESKQKYSYDFPEETIKKNYEKRGIWQRGQEITGFWVKFEGNKEELSPVDGIRKIKWVSKEELKENLIFPGQWENTSLVIEEFEKKI